MSAIAWIKKEFLKSGTPGLSPGVELEPDLEFKFKKELELRPAAVSMWSSKSIKNLWKFFSNNWFIMLFIDIIVSCGVFIFTDIPSEVAYRKQKNREENER